jgi:hypothetical protein
MMRLPPLIFGRVTYCSSWREVTTSITCRTIADSSATLTNLAKRVTGL